MKKIMFSSMGVLFLLALAAFNRPGAELLQGALSRQEAGQTDYILMKDGYLMHATYRGKTFLHSRGGTFTNTEDQIVLKIEFDTEDKEQVGTTMNIQYSKDRSAFYLNGNKWDMTDDGKGDLAGNWRITGRKQGEEMVPMNPGSRKTLKLLSGKRFQWAAINTQTGEFFGTGGGTYTFKDGKYTENIEFFSRDSSRVGASLSFDGKVNGNEWTHSGLSSKGDPIHEIWTRESPMDN